MTSMRVGPFQLETLHLGAGPPILLIHGIHPVHPDAPFPRLLAAHGEVIAPSHPGFGGSPLPPDFDTMYDLVNLYSAVLDAMPPGEVTVIGLSFGGWIAAELAVTNPKRLHRLVLADPLGIKISGREQRDIAHFFNTDPVELHQRSWHDPARRPAGSHGLGWQTAIGDNMTDQEMITLARNWDSLCLFGWRPHMFNPRLKDWLHRISVPTLVVWGQSDRVVTPDYGRAYAGCIPGARFTTIAEAGHHPELEQPEIFAGTVARFLPEQRR